EGLRRVFPGRALDGPAAGVVHATRGHAPAAVPLRGRAAHAGRSGRRGAASEGVLRGQAGPVRRSHESRPQRGGHGQAGRQGHRGTLRKGVEQVARSFIAGTNTEEVSKVVEGFHKQGLAFTVDVLGEATLSETEADDYQRRYLELLETLSEHAPRWPKNELVDEAPWGPLPRVNVSVK